MTNTINAGKVNFNVESAKDFRATMAIWHIFDFECKDVAKKYRNQIANRKGIIDADSECIEKKNFKMHDEQYYLDDIKEQNTRITELKAEHQAWLDAESANVKKVEALFSKALYKAYVESVDVPDAGWRATGYATALADLLSDNGLTPAWETIDVLYHAVKKCPGTGTTQAETGLHNRAQKEETWRKTIMGELCDLMGTLLPTYKFKNILTKAAKKAAKKAQNN